MLNINCGVFEYHNLFYDTEIFMKNIKITAQSNISLKFTAMDLLQIMILILVLNMVKFMGL